MWTIIYKIWRSFWSWFCGLSKRAIMIVCTSGTIIGCMGFAIFMLLRIDGGSANSGVETQLRQIRREATHRDSTNFMYWTRQYSVITDSINGISTAVRGHSRDISNITLILVANSNSDLIRRLQPYLDGVATKEDIYRFVMEMEKQEAVKRQPGIEARKVNRSRDEP